MSLTEQRFFEQQILNKISKFLGKTDQELFEYYHIKANPVSKKYPKNANGIIINRVLNVDIDEEIKRKIKDYDISIRTIRLDKKGRVRESLSLPNIDFEKMISEIWESSSLRQYLINTRYLFVVFKEEKDSKYQLIGAKFWSISANDLENTVKFAWLDTASTIKNGVKLCYNQKNKRVSNNFIKASENRIIHVRPRAAKSSYIAYNPSACRLPVPANWHNKPDNFSDDWMTRQCFWLNKNYIYAQVSEFNN